MDIHMRGNTAQKGCSSFEITHIIYMYNKAQNNSQSLDKN